MALSIVARRKVSLKGFAEGWDECFVIVRAVNEQERKDHAAKFLEMRREMSAAVAGKDQAKIAALGTELDEKADVLTREFAVTLIESGKVINTKEDGTTELVAFGKEDAQVVADALSFSWVNELVSVATGADRLKAQTTQM